MSPAALDSGPILFHEHLSLNLRGLEEHFTDDVALMIEEVKAAGSEGISCIVDAAMRRPISACPASTIQPMPPLPAALTPPIIQATPSVKASPSPLTVRDTNTRK